MAKNVEFYGGQLDGAVLQNAASEETLKQLVKAIGGGTGGGGGSGILGRTPMGMVAGGVVGLLTGAVKGTVNQIGNVTGAAGTFAGMLIKGEGRISSYTKVLNNQVISQLPLFGRVLGTVGGAVSGSIEAFERWNKSLMSLTSVGATFNNSILEMMSASTLTYMSLDDFSKMVAQNSTKLRAFGETVTLGAHAFAKVSDAALNGSGEARSSLISLGYTIPQINQSLINFMDLNYRGSRINDFTAKGVADSFVGYQSQLHTLTTLTGKRVDQIEAELASASTDAAYQLQIAKYSNESRAEMSLQLANFTQIHGEAGAKLFRARTLGLMAQGEDIATLLMMYPNLVSQMDNAIYMAKNNAQKGALLDERMIDTRTELIYNASKGLKEFDILLKAAASGDKDLQNLLGLNAETAALVAKLGVGTTIKNKEQLRSAIKRNYLEMKEKETFTESMRAFQTAILEFKRGFFMALIGTRESPGPLWEFSKAMEGEELPKKIRELGVSMGQFAYDAVPKMMMFFARFGTKEGRALYWLELQKVFDKAKAILAVTFTNMISKEKLDPGILDKMLSHIDEKYDPQIKKARDLADYATVNMLGGKNRPKPNQFFKNFSGGESQKERALMVYTAFINQGAPPSLAKVLTAEVFRENSLRSNLMLGQHTDPKNKETNIGMFSYQLDRAEAFKKFMGDDLNSPLSQANINKQAQFAIMEMLQMLGPDFLKKASEMSQAELHQVIGNEYIKWAINNPKYRDKGMLNLATGHRIIDEAIKEYSLIPQGYRSGNLGTMNTLLNNFGGGTEIETHGNEVIQTASEFVNDMTMSASESGAAVSELNQNLMTLISLSKERIEVANRLLDKSARKSNNLFAIAGAGA